MDKRAFVEAYVISAVCGSAIERGAITPEDTIAEAQAMWAIMEDMEPRYPPPSKAVKAKQD